jgi:type I restriction enzyme, S subunit
MIRYDSYKDSGVDWIESIPFEWNLKPFDKVLFENKNKYGSNDEHLDLLSLSGENGIYSKKYEDENQERNKEELENYNVVRKGQIVLNPLVNPLKLDYFGFSVSNIEGVVSPVYMVFETQNNSKYLEWFFKSHLTIQYLLSNTKGVRPLSLQLSRDSLKGIKIFLPPLSEQQQIVSFLDTKTSLIDSLIEKTQRKIELLKENRTSLINEVVTKGLNPNVEMKDSGVEWIGEIPSHWFCVGTNKVYHDLGTGTTPTSDNTEYYDESGHHWITTTDLNEGIMYDTLTKITDKSLEDYPNLRLYPYGSIFISMYGGRIGKLGVSTFESYCNQSVCVLPKNDKINVKFYYYWFLGFQELVKNMGRGGGQPNINKDMIKQFPTVKLSLSEQNEIVSYLDEHTQLIDKTISVEERRIDTLKEYRQSLISEVVTGKRKVVV